MEGAGMSMEIQLPDGTCVTVEEKLSIRQLLDRLPEWKNKITAAVIAGCLVDMDETPEPGARVEFLTFDDPRGREVYRHTAAHVLAQAVKRLHPQAKLGIGPAIEDGFYYDFDVGRPFTPEVLEDIEREMQEIIRQDLPIRRQLLSREDAHRLFREMGESYKLEILEELPDQQVSVYRQGDFVDLCTGPHLPRTGMLEAVKLLNAAGAYWRGDERRPMLQRIYGTAFPDRESLNQYLKRLEEARKRDHRRLGRELDLYSIQEECGPGLVLWHPKGAVIREIIENFWRREHRKRGYELVYSPHIGKADLWRKSGHLEWFRENMYGSMLVEGAEYLLKPMNCPFHILMYKSATRSYRDLPLRWAELGTVYRYERSGVLHGLLRVRGFTQDDAHIFCTRDQLEDEIVAVVELALFMLSRFGFEQFEVKLSVRDPAKKEKYVGDDSLWQEAEGALVAALNRLGMRYRVEEGEAKFYGPAIDIELKDALGRGWQGPTIQVDFNLPERFDLTYMGPDNRQHRPVMVHRTVLGALERFLGNLIEHYAGAFPTWLAPVQVRVIPVGERHLPYAQEVAGKLVESGFRVEVDTRNEKVGFKIRGAELDKIPYMLVVGDREQERGTVAVRRRREGDLGPMRLAEFAMMLEQEVRQWESGG